MMNLTIVTLFLLPVLVSCVPEKAFEVIYIVIGAVINMLYLLKIEGSSPVKANLAPVKASRATIVLS